MNQRNRNLAAFLATVMAVPCLAAWAGTIPLHLSRPDGKPGEMTKKVQVYILAGQSNMVGMGDLTGARPLYPSVFLSADPAIIPGVMPIGGSAVAAHGVYRTAEAESQKGAMVSLFQGGYDPKADYAKLTPVKTVPAALGVVAEKLPALDGPCTAVATAWIDVPKSETYTLHAGFGDSSHAIVVLDGKEVYRKEVGSKPVVAKIALEQGKRYPIRITYLKGGSAAFWLEQPDIPGKGDLTTLTAVDKKFPYLLDGEGKWTARQDVFYKEARLRPEGGGSPLSATSNNGRSIGPEVGFGWVMGEFHDEQVLLIKTAMGNRSLEFDFRPPSSGQVEANNEFEGLEYRLMLKGVRETLEKIDKVVPGYKGQGYEIAGFGWFQGHKDAGSTKEAYEKNLVNLIRDLRKDLNAPKMSVVVATVGFHGYRISSGPWQGVWEAQMAVGDPKQHPEFAGTVASVDTRDFWREVVESPKEQDYHYNRNAETYLLVGEAMGRAMARLKGGQAEAIPKSDREARVAAEVAAENAAKPAPTEEQKAAHVAAVKPMILDGALVTFLANPRNQPALPMLVKGERPDRVPPYLNDALDEVADYYRAAGIHDFDWKPFGGDMANASWEYTSFDLKKTEDRPKGSFDRNTSYPAGMESWFTPGFDAKKAGWKSGEAPFGQNDDNAGIPDWAPRCRVAPKTLCEKDVLLMRQAFDLPPLKDGYRYRIRIDGSAHVNMGEGYVIYVNGKFLTETKQGVVAWRKEGRKPRGSHVWADFRDEFKGGKATLAVGNFPHESRSNGGFMPHRAHLSVWIEEMKIPPIE